jgi:hypothetical protein
LHTYDDAKRLGLMPSMSQEQLRSSLAEMGEIYRLRDQAENKVAQNQRFRAITVIADIIKEWKPAALPRELQYRDSLDTFLRSRRTTARVEKEYRHLGTTIDIYVKEADTEIFIELKRNLLRKTEFDRLVGQIESLQPAQHSVIVVLCGETKASFIGRLKERYPFTGFDVLVIA